MSEWYKNIGPEGDVVVSTRIRIARNIGKIPFPARMNNEHLSQVNDMVKRAVKAIGDDICGKLSIIDMNSVTEEETYAMVERHIISPEFAQNRRNKILVLSPDESVSIMVCEEDHVRIQVIKSRMALQEAFSFADKLDKELKLYYKNKTL